MKSKELECKFCGHCGAKLSRLNSDRCPSCGKNTSDFGRKSKRRTIKPMSAKSIAILLIVATIIFICSVAFFMRAQYVANVKTECKNNDQIFVEDTTSCRDKTVSEKFDEKCNDGTYVGGKWFSCSEIKSYDLEQAYLTNSLITHGGELYEVGTSVEIFAGKYSKDYCLSASDTWLYIGEKRCVVFSYAYMSCSNGYCFLDEKQDYNNGFVAFFGRYRMYTWDSFKATFYGKGPILVCGTIYKYNGHPEIKITSTSQFLLSPNPTKDGASVVYRYTCS